MFRISVASIFSRSVPFGCSKRKWKSFTGDRRNECVTEKKTKRQYHRNNDFACQTENPNKSFERFGGCRQRRLHKSTSQYLFCVTLILTRYTRSPGVDEEQRKVRHSFYLVFSRWIFISFSLKFKIRTVMNHFSRNRAVNIRLRWLSRRWLLLEATHYRHPLCGEKFEMNSLMNPKQKKTPKRATAKSTF